SGGMRVASVMKIPYIQEVVACGDAIREYIPHTNVAIELGGEDAKISFFTDGEMSQSNMNATCAGGTDVQHAQEAQVPSLTPWPFFSLSLSPSTPLLSGAFIDTMAILLQTDASGLNDLAKEHTRLYPIASLSLSLSLSPSLSVCVCV
ncbi:hypothetical protein KIPB_013091, partial [Kipferlia bialata]